MTLQQPPLDHVVDTTHSIEQQLFDTQHELALLMNDYHIYPACCDLADRSNGWHHNGNCTNWQMPF